MIYKFSYKYIVIKSKFGASLASGSSTKRNRDKIAMRNNMF